jgi:hypothetical protein
VKQGIPDGTRNRQPINAVMLEESLIFRGENGVNHARRQVIDFHPARECVAATRLAQRDTLAIRQFE